MKGFVQRPNLLHVINAKHASNVKTMGIVQMESVTGVKTKDVNRPMITMTPMYAQMI